MSSAKSLPCEAMTDQSIVESSDFLDPLDFYQDYSLFFLSKKTLLRHIAIKITLLPFLEKLTMTIIFANCITLGLFDPYDVKCKKQSCKALEIVETCIYVYFALEMVIKMVAFGVFGKQGYLSETWNRLDLFIVSAGTFELAYGDGEFLSSIRVIRVLRPLRAINRVPSIRILVTLLLDTLPMLGNVFILFMLIIAVFAIIGVQLWQGILRNRCFHNLTENVASILEYNNISRYYKLPDGDDWSLICSSAMNSGQVSCNSKFIPKYDSCSLNFFTMLNSANMTLTDIKNVSVFSNLISSNDNTSDCINWNLLYTHCHASNSNPHYNVISFDSVSDAFIAIFQSITLEGWSEIMYFLQDAYSSWVWIYFLTLIVIGSYLLTNLCLVVVATQFSETRQRESALMAEARKKTRPGTFTSMSENENSGCYRQILSLAKYSIRNSYRRLRRKFIHKNNIKNAKLQNGSDGTVHFHHHYHHHHHHHHLHLCSSVKKDLDDAENDSLPDENHHASKCIKTLTENSIFNQLMLLPRNTASLIIPDKTVVICHGKSKLIASAPVLTAISMFPTVSKVDSSGDCSVNAVYQSLVDHSLSEEEVDEDYLEECKNAGCYDNENLKPDVSYKEKKITNFLSLMRNKFRVCCESNVFKYSIMIAIFLNSLTMACEHYNQPEKLTAALEVFNTIFTVVFMFECIFKLSAYGFYSYIKDPFNVFDAVIVIISLVEFIGASRGGGVSVLRTFRLMRIFKLIRFMPMLQKQVKVMLATLDSVMTFLGLLSIFIFTCSILGMHLFGAKMIFEEGSVRHNFDNLMWSLITVFQVLTQEDWNAVLYDAVRGTTKWASIYFIFIMVLGNYILFNLLVAILVEGFSTETDGILSSPLKLKSISREFLHNDAKENRVLVNSKKIHYYSLPNILSQENSFNELSHKDILLRNNKKFASETHIAKKDTELEEKQEEKVEGKKFFYKRCTFFNKRRNWSLYLFAPENKCRAKVYGLVKHPWFDYFILFFIATNCVIMALERPSILDGSQERLIIDYCNIAFTIVFTIEMMIKIFADGFYFGEETTYLRSGWNKMDFILVLTSLVDLFVTHIVHTRSHILGVLKVLRAFRTLRPLRLISRAPGLKIVVETLLASLAPIGNLVVVAFVFFTIFGILGVQLFKGKFHHCKGANETVTNYNECTLYGGSWENKKYNFDNLFQALFSLFVFATKDGWVSLMYDGIDAVGIDQEPIKNYNPWAFLYFVSFLLIAGFVVINMVVGVIIDNFQKCREVVEEEMEIPSGDLSDSNDEIPQTLNEYSYIRKKVYTFVSHYKFDFAIAIIIGLNVLSMAMEYYQMPEKLSLCLKILNYIFTSIFILEALLKIYGFGPRLFFKQRWNQLDIVIVFLSIIGIIFEEINSKLPINPTIIRVMRILRIARILKILKAARGIQKLLNCVSKAIPQVGNLSMLFALIFFIFSALGIELFGRLDCSRDECNGIGRHAHFKSFDYALLTLFRISTGDNWSGILKDTINEKLCAEPCPFLPYISPLYFAVFVLTSQFVLVNVVVAVLMKQLEDTKSVIETNSEYDSPSVSSKDETTKFCIEDKSSIQTKNREYEEIKLGEKYESLSLLQSINMAGDAACIKKSNNNNIFFNLREDLNDGFIHTKKENTDDNHFTDQDLTDQN